jgi:integrase/recombinase XerD
MKTVKLEKQLHKGEECLTLSFRYDAELVRIVRKMEGVKWSRTMNCYYLAFSEISINKVLTAFGNNATIDYSSIAATPEMKNVMTTGKVQKEEIQVTEGDEGFFIDNIPWKVKKPSGEMNKTGSFGTVKFSINANDGRLAIKFLGKYDTEWIKEIKSYGQAHYNEERKEWLLHWTRIAVDSLSDYFTSRGVKVNVEKIEIPALVKNSRVEDGQEIRERNLGVSAVNGIENVRQYLSERRYSIHTIESYISLLELFFKYFHTKDPEDITGDDISSFFNDFIVFHNYSSSYQNQSISAIKMFYRLNGGSRINTESLGRPRRGRALPKVFSKEEVKRILNSTHNCKHKLILCIIYSCGLRRGEVINIKVKDLERERGILNIREGKGKIDRIVPVSAKVWEKLDEYIESYKPVYWLFEGPNGGQYSPGSVYSVFKEALKKAGIKKDVGVHSLRHSYATHLHENGLDIRYIQELLGHKSTRTTEIYTHVSRRNLVSIRSPIEDLDIK